MASAEKTRQDEVYLTGVRTERMGETGRSIDLRRVLRRWGRGDLLHAGRAGVVTVELQIIKKESIFYFFSLFISN